MASRSMPNILITGTPGVGKSSLCMQLAETTGMEWLEVSRVAKENNCLSEYDEVYKCSILDEERLLDEMEDEMEEGGKIVDYHGCDFFPERWFDIVFVLNTNNTELYNRLARRGYTGKKLEDNVQCEIFQTIFEEAVDSYKQEIVHKLESDNMEHLENNVKRICAWIKAWCDTHSG